MKPLYINGRFLRQPLSGMQRFALEMVKAIDQLLVSEPNNTLFSAVVVLTPQGPLHPITLTKVRIQPVGRLQGHLWEQIELAWAAKDGMLLNLTSCGPLVHNNSVLVMHDAGVFVYPNHFSHAYRTLHQFLRPRLAKKAKRLVTISEFSRKELAHWCAVSEERFSIIGDSAEHILQVESDDRILLKNGLVKGKFALTVGNQSPNKNINLAIQAFIQAAPKDWLLAVAGGGGSIFGDVKTADDKRVVRLGRVTDEQLKALYENAGLFLFPSEYEGFGVPPLEAMSLGCPVLSSNAAAMPEILGAAAAFFEAGDINSFASQIETLCEDAGLRKTMTERGLVRSRAFSWNESGLRMMKVLRDIA